MICYPIRIRCVYGLHASSSNAASSDDISLQFSCPNFSMEMQAFATWRVCLPVNFFDVEADCYWCLCKVLDSIQDHYTFAQPGIQKICFRIGEVSCCGLGDSTKKSVIYSVGNLFSTGGQVH